MKLYKYWAKGDATVRTDGRPWTVTAFGGSDTSLGEAQQRGRERAERMAAAIARRGDRLTAYDYGERPLREELIQEIRNGDEIAAVITRNSYGALVLNTNRVMFVDVDRAASGAGLSLGKALKSVWAGLRGKGADEKQAREQEILKRFARVSESRPEMGFRVYRTNAGYRLLVTSSTFDPKASETLQLLEAFGSDPLYIRLCKAQECFRARLSAKYWRCGARRPPSRFPWDDAAMERKYREWEESYHRLANTFAVCELVEAMGSTTIDESVRPILDTHDRLTMLPGATLA